jgi:nucleoside-diphosphate-sugar epimerase
LIQIHRGQRLTFPVYVPDVAQAILLALTKGERGAVYNICGEPLTHHAANQIISQLAQLTTFRLNIPANFMLWYARYQTFMAQRSGIEPDYPIDLAKYVFYDWNVSSQKARTHLSFSPTPFSEGARATINWYREIGMLPK